MILAFNDNNEIADASYEFARLMANTSEYSNNIKIEFSIENGIICARKLFISSISNSGGLIFNVSKDILKENFKFLSETQENIEISINLSA